jgi:alpha-galactosidase
MNNWQSGGPTQVMAPGERLAGLQERMAAYSRFVFTPVPEEASRTLVSDYFVGGPDGLAGFLASRTGHPYFAVEGKDLVGYIEYFGTEMTGGPLEPLLVLRGRPLESLLTAYAERVAEENGVRPARANPIGWSSWYQYFTGRAPADLAKNLRLARRGGYAFDVFQIDDGYEADIGDWLETKPGFGSLAAAARMIRDAGMTAGSGRRRSALRPPRRCSGSIRNGLSARTAGAGRLPNGAKTITPWTRPIPAPWPGCGRRSRNCGGWAFRISRSIFSFPRPSPVAASSPSRLSGIPPGTGRDPGDGWNGFHPRVRAPLLPSLGLVDGMRVGEDTAPFWDSAKSGIQGPNAKIAIKKPILRWFMHRLWWLNDPDSFFFARRSNRLQPNERALYAGRRAAGRHAD